ncbi:MAG: Crp/Fnr family transcriptional regulator [Burkholderiales bacterium]
MFELMHTPKANGLLATLSRKNYDELIPQLDPVTLNFGDVLYEPGSRIRNVYFPADSVISLLTVADTDRAAEVGLIGREGIVGIPIAFGVSTSPLRAVCQGAGAAMRMEVAAFRRVFAKQPRLQAAVFRFAHSLMSQVAQTAACNRYHRVGERLARWLLMTQDRVKRNEFRLTHEFLAKMLGVRRVGVSQAASILQKRKVIRYTRGNIVILDRAALIASTCACYEFVNRIYAEQNGGGKRRG